MLNRPKDLRDEELQKEPVKSRIPMATKLTAPAHNLRGVSATLLMALAARTLAPIEAPELGFADPDAGRILRSLQIDPRQFELSAYSVRAVVLRSQWLAKIIRRFIERYPEGLCINVGCGLTASYQYVANAGAGQFGWIDLDLPEVIEMRRRFFVETARRRIMAGDVTDPRLFTSLPWVAGEPALVVAEGLLYYLQPAQIATFFGALAQAADARRAHIEIAFDYASRLGAWIACRIPAHRQLGTKCHWTVRRASELRRIDPRLEVAEDSSVFLRAMNLGARQVNAISRFVTGSGLGGCAHLRRPPKIPTNSDNSVTPEEAVTPSSTGVPPPVGEFDSSEVCCTATGHELLPGARRPAA